MPHALLRLKSPDRMGKSSLLVRVLEEAQRLDNRTTWIDLQKCDRKFFENMDRFLQWFCAVIGRDLGVKAKTNGFRFDWGRDLFASVRSIVNTGKRQGLSAFESILVALNPLRSLFSLG